VEWAAGMGGVGGVRRREKPKSHNQQCWLEVEVGIGKIPKTIAAIIRIKGRVVNTRVMEAGVPVCSEKQTRQYPKINLEPNTDGYASFKRPFTV
jgi:hypothetical protein